MTNAAITSAARTATGSYGKGLRSVSPSDLGATAGGGQGTAMLLGRE